MDQLPVEISQRIRHEARVAGLHDHAPSIEMVERRRMQLWSLTIVVLVATGLTALAVSGATGNVSWITGEPLILAGGVAVLGRRLRRSTRSRRRSTSTGCRACSSTSVSSATRWRSASR